MKTAAKFKLPTSLNKMTIETNEKRNAREVLAPTKIQALKRSNQPWLNTC